VAVRAASEGAYLYGESVVALLGLSPTDPRAIEAARETERRGLRHAGRALAAIKSELDAKYPGGQAA
jgi:hypothetical protein